MELEELTLLLIAAIFQVATESVFLPVSFGIDTMGSDTPRKCFAPPTAREKEGIENVRG